MSQRPVVRAGHTARECRPEPPVTEPHSKFNLSGRDDESVALLLLGELDITSMSQFEHMITEVLSGSPKELIFDLTPDPVHIRSGLRRYRSLQCGGTGHGSVQNWLDIEGPGHLRV